MAPTHLTTATAALALVAASLVAPGLTTPVLGSTWAATATDVAGPVETNLTATRVGLGMLGLRYSGAVAVDGSIVVGWSDTMTSESEHAFAYDLAAPKPVMQDLGTLGGRTSHPAGVSGTVVVGESSDASGRQRAFAYDLAADEPVMVDLGTLGGDWAKATAISGTIVVGESSTEPGGGSPAHAFAYDLAAAEPTMVDLGTLGGDYSAASDVDGTIVVGTSRTATGDKHAFAYDLAAAEPVMIDLGTLGGDHSEPASASTFGPPGSRGIDGTIIVGRSKTVSGAEHAFAYELAAAEPTMVDLGTLGGRTSHAAGVSGTVVVGTSDDASGHQRAFAYDLAADKPAMRVVGPRGAASSRARAIDGDIVIGSWKTPENWETHAFAHDLGATDARFLDLGRRPGGYAFTSAIDGNVVVGEAAYNEDFSEATAWVLRDTTQPMIAFRRVDHRVKEGVGRATIRVIRYGRTNRAVKVRYRTHSRTAQAGQDFVATSGTLRFPRGVTRRSFKVKILDDRKRERTQFLLLTLSRPSAPALLGSPKWSQLRIQDNDR